MAIASKLGKCVNMVQAKMEESKMQYLKPDVYIGTYANCEETTIRSKKTNTDEKVLRHYWEILTTEKPVILNELSDVKMTPKNKLGQIAKTLLNKEIKTNEVINFDTLFGKKAKLVIEDKIDTSTGMKYSKITNHLPVY